MIVNSELAERIAVRWKKFSPSWETLSDEHRDLAVKALILCEMNGGRNKTAKLLDVVDNSVDNYRRGASELKHTALVKLTESAGLPPSAVNYHWVFEEKELFFKDAAGKLHANVSPSSTVLPTDFDDPPFPYAPGHDEAASQGGFQESSESPTTVLFSWFRSHLHVDPKHVMVLIAKGNAMDPAIVDGTPVFIDISERELGDGLTYVFKSDGDFVIRRVQRLVDGGVELVSNNSRLYPPQRIRKSKLFDLDVIGRVRFPPMN